jgi:hypothetical protein
MSKCSPVVLLALCVACRTDGSVPENVRGEWRVARWTGIGAPPQDSARWQGARASFSARTATIGTVGCQRPTYQAKAVSSQAISPEELAVLQSRTAWGAPKEVVRIICPELQEQEPHLSLWILRNGMLLATVDRAALLLERAR